MKNSSYRYLFFRVQFFSYATLIVMTVCILLAISMLVDSALAVRTLSMMVVIVALLAATGQVVIQYMVLGRFLKPLQTIQKVLATFLPLQGEGALDADLENRIRQATHALTALLEQFKDSLPRDVRDLQVSFLELLTLLEQQINKSVSDTILIGLGEITSQVAHDIRSPVATIKTGAALLNSGLSHSKLEELGKLISRACDRLSQMADELLDYRRAGQIQEKSVDLGNLINDICHEFSRRADSMNIAYAGPSHCQIAGDDHKLSRVFHNLIQNALQALDGNKEGRIMVRVIPEKEKIKIDIEDNGPGIPEEHLSKMFSNRFTTKGNSGTGLGLIYCHQVVQAHGGEIAAQNCSSGGARISITLPTVTLN